MKRALDEKRILVIDDDPAFNMTLSSYLRLLGATVLSAEDGAQALLCIENGFQPELIFCDLNMPVMSGTEFIAGIQPVLPDVPVIVISATQKMSDIDDALRLGAKDVLLKPLNRLEEVKKLCLSHFYPLFFSPGVLEQNSLSGIWSQLQHNVDDVLRLLKQLNPPPTQVLANYQIRYAQLSDACQTGLVFDVAEFSDNEVAFYCLDISKNIGNGPLVAMLIRVIFNDLLKRYIHNNHRRLPSMTAILNKLNTLLQDAGIPGQLPLLLGYYHTQRKSVLLSSAGISAELRSENNVIRVNRGIPLGTLSAVYSSQISEFSPHLQCRIWNGSSQIKLSLTPGPRYG
ncbi:two-component system response regulator RssB [Morganella psychrotolerans]|uniref:Regulator of RpoS n=1 Tax=Morganella psychrotolerans TaxID=368603 RepID=A0A1B8H721_9GAMM|nr:two-component system response regulator RssB [Morganella psychrotolerans]OBU04860.1 response regulator of RpoS [Morganella psychrotolerans]